MSFSHTHLHSNDDHLVTVFPLTFR